jgi:hypothetical protein
MPKLVDILLKEVSYRGRDSKKLDTLLASINITTSAAYSSARRGRPTADQRDLASKAGTKPSLLLKEFGISSVSPEPIPESAIENLIVSLLNGSKRNDFEQLFKRGSVKLIKHGEQKQLAIWIGLTEVSQTFIKKYEAIKKEFAYWIYSIIIAADKTYRILNGIKLEGQLKVDYNQSSYIVYLSRRSWKNL